jgi:ParB-like chromosome segregation protein Spo0J
MYKHNEASEGFPVADLSSKEQDAFPEITRDEAIAWKLFGDLNHGRLGPLGDGHAIILSDSEEEDEVRKDNHTDAEAMPSSTRNSPSPTASVATNDAPDVVQDDSSGDGTPNRVLDDSNDGGDVTGIVEMIVGSSEGEGLSGCVGAERARGAEKIGRHSADGF